MVDSLKRLTVGILAFVLLTAGCSTSTGPEATEYPDRPIKLVVPFSVGGGTDTFARIIKQAIDDQDILPQPIVVINQGGAGATIGSRRVMDAEPDGYTLLVLHDAIVTAKYSGKVDYGPEAFEAVAGTGEQGMVLAVSESSTYKSLPELMAAVQERPNEVTFGANLGALTHFAGLQLEQLTPGARFRFAQIGGGAERFADLKGGHIDVTGFSIEEFVRFRSEGLRGLAYFGRSRHPAASDVPTAAEQGVEMYTSSMFYWWFPKGTPRPVCDRIADALEQAMQTEYVQGKMDDIHCDPVFLRGAELQRRLEDSISDIARVAPRESVALPPIANLTLWAVGLMLVPVAIGGWRDAVRRSAERRVTKADDPPSQNGLALATAGLTVAYPAAMALGVDFRIATFAFVVALGLTLLRRRSYLAWGGLLVAAALMSFGLHALFTRLFVVDLP